ncbi:nuclease HARBI1 [Trichonephila clavipes]|nr:nuclease HARBI1 [Trichonephila clavipes]
MIYGTCRGGDVITGVEESDDGCSCRRRWSSLRNSVAREDALRLAETPVEQVLIALRFYAVACMQLAIADLFDVSQPTVCRVVHRVSEAIASLLPDFIHLPVNREECKTVSRKFFSIAGFPKVIGALDGTFVRIVSPRRFPCLSIGLNCHIDRVPAIVVACCVLHNLCIRLEDPEPPADPQIEALVRQLELENEDATLSFETRPRCPAGFAKRNVIVTNFFLNLIFHPQFVLLIPQFVLLIHLHVITQLLHPQLVLLIFLSSSISMYLIFILCSSSMHAAALAAAEGAVGVLARFEHS